MFRFLFLRLFFLTLFFICIVSPVSDLGAEWRKYEGQNSKADTLKKLLSQMEKEKVRFSIKRVYNEKTEGKSGFVLILLPKKTICKIIFHNRTQKNGVLLRVFTQNYNDSRFFHKIIVKKLGMKESGVSHTTEDEKWQKKMHPMF